ncbi:MAG: hypothetical protein Q9P90_12440 [candidate division KSB1 bacterium]|nr:hypothetical protein [candidate division KSB1 bacterium]
MRRTLGFIFAVVLLLMLLHLLASLLNIAFLRPWSAAAPDEGPAVYKVTGATHIHTRHSDGSGTLTDILTAARANSLDFVWISDHNTLALIDSTDGRGRPLVLVGAELSLRPGHLLEYGLSEWTSEQAMGGLSGILDRLEQRHGLALIAHPFHPKIRWRDSVDARIQGMEILNADVEWRNDAPLELLGTLFAYPFFRHAMNALIDVPRRELRMWDSLTVQRPFVGLASVDAHAKIKLSKTSYWKFPPYDRVFALIQNVLYLRAPLASEPDRARSQILEALRRGRLAFGFSGLGDLRMANLWLQSGSQAYLPGETVQAASFDSLRIQLRLPAQHAFETYLYLDGVRIASSRQASITWPIREPGVYRVAVFQRRIRPTRLSRVNIPWLFANPFSIRKTS